MLGSQAARRAKAANAVGTAADHLAHQAPLSHRANRHLSRIDGRYHRAVICVAGTNRNVASFAALEIHLPPRHPVAARVRASGNTARCASACAARRYPRKRPHCVEDRGPTLVLHLKCEEQRLLGSGSGLKREGNSFFDEECHRCLGGSPPSPDDARAHVIGAGMTQEVRAKRALRFFVFLGYGLWLR